MLIGNYSVLKKSPGRFLAGSSTAGGAAAFVRSNFNTPSDWRKFGMQDRSGGTGEVVRTASKPSGYYPPGAWALPVSAGSMSTYGALVGSGSLVGSGALGLNAEAPLSGSGDISSAALALIVSAVAALSGSGDLTASIAGKLEAAASLAGSGDIAGAMGALAGLAAELEGSGGATGTFSASGSMSASIVVTGDLLSTANVGEAVWAQLLEAGFDASRILRIIAAASAGKSTGGPGSPVFRNLSDSQDQIDGSANSSGDRSSITYGD